MKRKRKTLGALLLALAALAAAGYGYARHVAHRALPQLDGELAAPGLAGRVEVLRDRWGVPHVFAPTDDAAYYALGYVHAQDRLFQLELHRHAAQGRLAELFGERAVRVDRLFRTMAFHPIAQRMLRAARPEARAAAEAYARGVNAAVAALDGRLPPEFALLGHDFEPVVADDFVGILGYMAWGLNVSWFFDPLYEQLVEKLGPERAAELFPYNDGGSPSVHPPPAGVEARGGPTPAAAAAPPTDAAARGAEAAFARRLFAWSDAEEALLDALPSLRASNNWVIGPHKSASGRPILANDPHLAHALPGIWYEAHLATPTQDVIGVTLVGFPLVVIGHNRDVAWGFTNVMLDGADLFVEKLDAARPGQVLHRGEWVALAERRETLRVKGGDDVTLTVRTTPHGPIVNDLLAEREEAPVAGLEAPLAYQWNYAVASGANEVDGLWLLNRARDWQSFRAAVRHFGAVSQNVVYADRAGHIGLQTTGAVPRYTGKPDGTRLRSGWDGSDEWDGFQPFEALPASFDPPRGWLASANNPTLAPPMPFHISSQWEPVDRITRIQELLEAKPKLSLDDMKAIQSDTLLVSARELAPLVVAACDARPASDAALRAAVEELRGWDGAMHPERAAPALFAAFYRRLFYALFEDELGAELAKGYRSKANLSAIMMRAVVERGPAHWWDDARTPVVEDRDAILRGTFAAAVVELSRLLGGAPAEWRWGRLHTLTLSHPLGSVPLVGRYFDRGPFPVPGATSTVNKMEYRERDFRVAHGPSMRQITDLADLDAALAVLPGGQSGIPASPHYDDHAALWRRGEYHPSPLSRQAVERVTAHRLTLVPAP